VEHYLVEQYTADLPPPWVRECNLRVDIAVGYLSMWGHLGISTTAWCALELANSAFDFGVGLLCGSANPGNVFSVRFYCPSRGT
jgi:hypothetical protein